MNIEEFKKIMISYAEKINIKFTEEQLEKFYQYMNMLLEWNEKINLTAIVEPKEVILKHFIDSLTINKYLKENATLADVGTGAGFPGIPLKILRPDIKVTLVDSLNKRINFLNEVIEKLNLEDIICDEELANIKCKTYFLKQTKHEIDIKEPKQKFPYSNKDDSVSSLINEEYSYRENNSNIDICETKISYAA